MIEYTKGNMHVKFSVVAKNITGEKYMQYPIKISRSEVWQ